MSTYVVLVCITIVICALSGNVSVFFHFLPLPRLVWLSIKSLREEVEWAELKSFEFHQGPAKVMDPGFSI